MLTDHLVEVEIGEACRARDAADAVVERSVCRTVSNLGVDLFVLFVEGLVGVTRQSVVDYIRGVGIGLVLCE